MNLAECTFAGLALLFCCFQFVRVVRWFQLPTEGEE